jgi:succinate dehydrogenase / fumarate reductase cytochrome b subunit
MDTVTARRPKYLNLFRIRQPVPAIVSILHRISGAALFLFAWALLWLLQSALQSPEGFERVRTLLDHGLVKLFWLGIAWALLHHLFAGVRYLLLDLHIGIALAPARASAWAVLLVSLALTIVVGARLW